MSKLLDQYFSHSTENALGGEDFYDAQNGKVASSHPNVFGGLDYFDENHHKIGESHENSHGGMDVYEDGSLVAQSIDMPHATLVRGEHGENLGTLHEGQNGSYFADLQGHLSSWQDNFLEGYSVNPNLAKVNIVFPSLL